MRHDELRALIHRHFQAALAARIDKIGSTGPASELELAPQRTTQMLAEASAEDYWGILAPDGTDAFLTRFCDTSGLPQDEADADPARVLREYHLAHRGFLRALVKHQTSLGHYDFDDPEPSTTVAENPTAKVTHSIPLQQAIDEYISENRRAGSWRGATFDKKVATLNVLTEFLGEDRPMSAITKHDAQETKRVVLELPANRNKIPQTRNLPLLEAILVQRVPKITTVTVNSYLSVFQSFYDWAAKNGHAEANLFSGMRVGKASNKAQPQRKAYKPDALRAVYREVTENALGLVKTDCHKWATLIGMFTGARLNEICQLETVDVQQAEGIWFFNLIDEGNTHKRFKSAAALRKVPVHDELVRLGFLDYHANMASQHATRLFPEYSYCAKNGYGRALSRWFNATLTLALQI